MLTLELGPEIDQGPENEVADQAAELLEQDTGDDVEPTLRECKPGESPDIEIKVTTDQPISDEAKQQILQAVGDLCSLPLTEEQTAKLKAESDFRIRIEQLSKNVADAAVEWTAAKAHAKSAKGHFDDAVSTLTDATDEGPCYMRFRPLFDRAPASELDVEVSTDPPPKDEPVLDPDAWRKPAINEIGLKPKLAETLLLAGIETIGMLEDLRADISQGRKKWPKGIGAAKITQIEDTVIEWLSKNRDRQVLSEAKDEGEAAHDALMARATDLDNGDFESKHEAGKQFWASGFEASQRGLELRECPYVAGAEQDDWIRGWFKNENTFTAPTAIDLDDL